MTPPPARKPAPHTTPADTTQAVDAFMHALKHPHKAAVQRLREIILAADGDIAEGVKWNAPSFRTHEYFATTYLRAKAGIGLVLHLGAKARAGGGVKIDDPGDLLQWLAKDRAMVTFADEADLAARRAALTGIIRQWIAHV
ncbi:MAG: DUF1801 domain-containing protein [Phycisphaeraceae bacterium]|nr:DUF1801 domain-containing protein [Phycisphaeraceae bacterium]